MRWAPAVCTRFLGICTRERLVRVSALTAVSATLGPGCYHGLYQLPNCNSLIVGQRYTTKLPNGIYYVI